ncbi:MAG: PspC domain-containing protein [Candidatus Gribaldobacteria bacterium]|nr:PspC domain-containing protein [Candidatus Gribaldobacteria bacterium]
MEKSTKKLYRAKQERIIAGVAGGLGEYFKIDPVLVRIIFVALALVHGLGILLYVLFWLIVPNEGGGNITDRVASFSATLKRSEEKLANKIKELKKSEGKGQVVSNEPAVAEELPVIEQSQSTGQSWFHDKKRVVGLAIIILGGTSFLGGLIDISWFKWDLFWPIALVIVGFYLLISKNNIK